MRQTIKWSMVLGILMIIAGILAIAVPVVAGIAVDVLVAWLFVLSGLMHLVYGWSNRSAHSEGWELAICLLYLGIGGYILVRPLAGLAALTLGLTVFLLIEAAVELGLFFQLKSYRGAGWFLMKGVITLILAVVIGASWPGSSEWAIGTLLGISMLFSGISRVMMSYAVHKMAA